MTRANPDLSGGKPVPGPTMYQVGTEGGFLPAVAVHPNGIPCPLDLVADPSGNTANPDGPFNLLLAPAERADVLIDFTGLNGKSFILYSDAPAPFPGVTPGTTILRVTRTRPLLAAPLPPWQDTAPTPGLS